MVFSQDSTLHVEHSLINLLSSYVISHSCIFSCSLQESRSKRIYIPLCRQTGSKSNNLPPLIIVCVLNQTIYIPFIQSCLCGEELLKYRVSEVNMIGYRFSDDSTSFDEEPAGITTSYILRYTLQVG